MERQGGMGRLGVIAFSKRGGKLAEKLMAGCRELGWETEGYLPAGYARAGMKPFGSLRDLTGQLFGRVDMLVFMGACGIAVRAVAPYIKSKLEDPGVVVIDECGTFAISLLSGHVGGANAFARLAARIVGAAPVITTATDRSGLFAADEWAARHFLRMMAPETVKEISARLLAGEQVGFFSTLPVSGELPAGLVWTEPGENKMTATASADCLRAGIVVSPGPLDDGGRFPVCCHLLPADLVVGMGCRKGKSFDDLQEFLYRTLQENGLTWERVGMLCSIREKAGEEGLVRLAKSLHVPFRTWSGAQLLQAEGTFAASDFVRGQMGVDNVCERSAALGSAGGEKLVEKQAYHGMTLAIYRRKIRLSF